MCYPDRQLCFKGGFNGDIILDTGKSDGEFKKVWEKSGERKVFLLKIIKWKDRDPTEPLVSSPD